MHGPLFSLRKTRFLLPAFFFYIILPVLIAVILGRFFIEERVFNSFLYRVLMVLSFSVMVGGICYFFVVRKMTLPALTVLDGTQEVKRGIYMLKEAVTDAHPMGINGFSSALKKLSADEKQFRVIVSHMKDIVFEWNIGENEITFLQGNNQVPFQGGKIHIDQIQNARLFHDSDVFTFTAMLETISFGIAFPDAEIRLKTGDDRYIWGILYSALIVDEDGIPVKGIGGIREIDTYKKDAEKLRVEASSDTLTGLYNKGAAISVINKILKGLEGSSLEYGFIIVDIDNFKEINDNQGHLFGDEVLASIGGELKNHFPSPAIAARIGGDEFLIFFSENSNGELLKKKTDDIIGTFRKIFTANGIHSGVSGSVGASLYPRDGSTYEELFMKADTALYNAKSQGKNCCCIYTPDLMSIHDMRLKGRSGRTSRGEILKGTLLEEICRAPTPVDAIESILSIAGAFFEASRMYVFQLPPCGRYMICTYEWRSSGIESRKYYFPAGSDRGPVEGHEKDFDPRGLFWGYRDALPTEDTLLTEGAALTREISDFMKTRDATAVLHAAILKNGEFRGFTGIDQCWPSMEGTRRVWTAAEKELLLFISGLIGALLSRKDFNDDGFECGCPDFGMSEYCRTENGVPSQGQ
ncbi:MAG: GGDEF domain-containing protein [Spirochaetaceae bacterium]|nr:GGDEF domain-containing protein [Spirochaetaceae bacterium]